MTWRRVYTLEQFCPGRTYRHTRPAYGPWTGACAGVVPGPHAPYVRLVLAYPSYPFAESSWSLLWFDDRDVWEELAE